MSVGTAACELVVQVSRHGSVVIRPSWPIRTTLRWIQTRRDDSEERPDVPFFLASLLRRRRREHSVSLPWPDPTPGATVSCAQARCSVEQRVSLVTLGGADVS